MTDTPQSQPSPSPAPSAPEPPDAFDPLEHLIDFLPLVLPPLGFRASQLQAQLLVDVTPTAQEVGFAPSVAVTPNLWKDISEVPEAYSHEDIQGRLWDVLWLARFTVQQAEAQETVAEELRYVVALHTPDSGLYYPVRITAEPGDAEGEFALTLSSVDKDRYVDLGEIILTRGALHAFRKAQASPPLYLARHRRGDWGEVDQEDWASNDRAVREGQRLVSAYTLPETGVKIWIITEWDRSVTTLLLPSEY